MGYCLVINSGKIGQRVFSIMQHHPKEEARVLFNAALNAVLPNSMVNSLLRKNSDGLWVGTKCYPIRSRHISVVGFGKAVVGMARAVQDIIGEDLQTGLLSVPLGILETLIKTGKSDLLPRGNKIKIYEGAKNNLPDSQAFQAAVEILKFVASLTEKDLLLVLISGGGSALLPMPVPSITLEEKCEATKLLANCGANIQELNVVRTELSLVKGGKLGMTAWPAQAVSLILSDVVGDALDQIASGPTVEHSSNADDAMAIIEKYSLRNLLPKSVVKLLEAKAIEVIELRALQSHIEKSGFRNVDNYLIGNNATALDAAQKSAEQLGYAVCKLSAQIHGEARSFAELLFKTSCFVVDSLMQRDTTAVHKELQVLFAEHGVEASKVQELHSVSQHSKRIAILSGGETVVRVMGTGRGGRNQETALACSLKLHHSTAFQNLGPNLKVTLLCAGTDGQDGPTDASGAFAYLGQMEELLMDDSCNVQSFLDNNDSNGFYARFIPNDLLITGVTGTNVMDVHILLISLQDE